MNKILSFGFIIISSIFYCSLANAALITVYTDRTTWESALAGAVISTETFSTPIAAADVIALDNGIVSTANPTSFSYNRVSGGVFGGYACSVTACNSFAPDDIGWALPSAVNAIGGDFFGVNSSGGVTIDIDSLGYSGAAIFDSLGGSNGFYGLISDTQFSNIAFRCAGNCGDAYSIDNFSSASVPEPTSLLLLGIGLAGLGFARKRRADA